MLLGRPAGAAPGALRGRAGTALQRTLLLLLLTLPGLLAGCNRPARFDGADAEVAAASLTRMRERLPEAQRPAFADAVELIEAERGPIHEIAELEDRDADGVLAFAASVRRERDARFRTEAEQRLPQLEADLADLSGDLVALEQRIEAVAHLEGLFELVTVTAENMSIAEENARRYLIHDITVANGSDMALDTVFGRFVSMGDGTEIEPEFEIEIVGGLAAGESRRFEGVRAGLRNFVPSVGTLFVLEITDLEAGGGRYRDVARLATYREQLATLQAERAALEAQAERYRVALGAGD